MDGQERMLTTQYCSGQALSRCPKSSKGIRHQVTVKTVVHMCACVRACVRVCVCVCVCVCVRACVRACVRRMHAGVCSLATNIHLLSGSLLT